MNWFYHTMLLALYFSYGYGNEMTVCKQFKSPLNSKPVKQQCTGQTVFLEKNGPKGEKGEKGSSDKNEIELLKKKVTEINSLVKVLTSSNPQLCYAGVKNGKIPNSAMTASSFWSSSYRPSYGRLDGKRHWHVGKSSKSTNKDKGAWLQVDFGSKIRLAGVVTQGRPTSSKHWVTSYKILYGDSMKALKPIQKNGKDVIFQGNRDRTTHVTNYFPTPITARYFRLVVVTYHGAIALRLEYLKC